MGFGFRLLPKGIEEGAFKPVAEGWLLKTANPYLFGPARTYFVSEAQKPAVAAQVRRSRYGSVIAAVVLVELSMALGVLYPSLLSATPKAIAVWSAAFLLACVFVATLEFLIMRPVVRDLPRSTQKVRFVDVWKRLDTSLSTTTIAFFTAFSAFAGVTNLYMAVAEGKLIGWLGGPFMVALTIFYGAMLVTRLRGKAAASQG